jgi:hypothetical protein
MMVWPFEVLTENQVVGFGFEVGLFFTGFVAYR